MIDYFIGWQAEGGFSVQIESIEVINPSVAQCDDLINALSGLLWDLTKQRDILKEL